MKTDCNILFINPSSMPSDEQEAFLSKQSMLRVPSFSMPLGLMDMAANLRESFGNVRLEILDISKDIYKLYLDENRKPLTMSEFTSIELAQVKLVPDIVGVSILFSSAHNSSVKIIEQIKGKWPDALIICGGNHATNYIKYLFEVPQIDYVAKGEGEVSLNEFVGKFINGEKAPNVMGFFDREKFNSTNGAEMVPMIQDLDEIPLPAYDLLDMDFYRKTVGSSIMFTRGCPFKCSFCATRTVHGSKVRFKSINRVKRELNCLIKDYNFSKIIIEDDLFAAKKKNFVEIADYLNSIDRNIQFQLPQGLSVAMLDQQIIDVMVGMGINEASVAIESGSEYTQKEIIKKNVSLDKARAILIYFRQIDFSIYINLILGFPGETRELMQETIDFIDTIDVDWIYIFHALPLPGSEVYNILVNDNIIDPATFNWDSLRLGRRGFDTPEISAADLEQLVYDTNISCNFFGNSNLKNKRYDRAIDIFNRIILDQYPFHVVGRYCRALAYMGIGQTAKAEEEFRLCVEWINKNKESKKLHERYGSRMSMLKQYM